MYKRVLIATDGSELASKAVAHGIALAKALNVPVCVVTVTEMWSASDLARMARLGNQKSNRAIRRDGVRCSKQYSRKGHAGRQVRGHHLRIWFMCETGIQQTALSRQHEIKAAT